MIIIITIYAILFCASLIPIKEEKQKKELVIVVFALGAIILCLRDKSVGIDTKYYYNTISSIISFDSWNYNEFPVTVEPLYFYFTKILSILIPNPYFVLMIFSAFTMYAFGKFIYRYSNDIVLSCLMFFSSAYFSLFNIMRQYLAMAFILYAIMSAVKGKKVIPCLLLLIGGMIHYSALVFFPFLIVLFIYKTESTKKTLILSIGTVASLGIMTYIIDIVITYIPKYARFFEWEGNADLRATGVSLVGIFLWVIRFVLILSYFMKQYKFKKRNIQTLPIDGSSMTLSESPRVIYAMTVITVAEFVVWIIASQMWIAGRFETLFSFASLITFPYFLSYFFYKPKIRIKNGYFIVRTLFVLYYLILSIRYVTVDPHQIFPYAFFWW